MTAVVKLVRDFRYLHALVIGDAMLDTYFEGTAARLCREGPVPIVRKTAELRAPGGAANTAANLRALDANVVFLGFVGSDTTGTLLRSALRQRDVDDSWLVEDEFASTPHKLRILADGQYVVRFDDDETHHYSSESHKQLLANLEKVFPDCDLFVVSDYCYGVMSNELIDRLRVLQATHPKVLLIDSKDLYRAEQLTTLVRPADVVITISASGNSPNVLAAARAARQLGAVVIALTGQSGGQLCQLADLTIRIPAQLREKVEDVHLIIAHSLCVVLRRQLYVEAALQEVEQSVFPHTIVGTAVVEHNP